MQLATRTLEQLQRQDERRKVVDMAPLKDTIFPLYFSLQHTSPRRPSELAGPHKRPGRRANLAECAQLLN